MRANSSLPALPPLVASQLAEVRAMVEYRLALIALYRAEGSLLERRGLAL